MLYLFHALVLLAAGSVQGACAHTTFTNFYIDGVNQGDAVAVRMNNNPGKATFPISSITSPDMACGVDGDKGVSRVVPVKAGATITFEWRDHPDDSAPGAIDVSHKGPCAVYMKRVEDSSSSNNAAGAGWFKIMELGYDADSKKWCTELLEPNNGHLAAAIPRDLAPGYYLMRPELLALHQADKNPPDPQFYVGCAQIFLSSDGDSKPKDTVSIPGYVDLKKTPAMTYNVWKVPLQLPFPDFGPPVYTSDKPKLRLDKRAMQQTSGLKPKDCAMSNANWCAKLPPSYSDQKGCWAASKDCYSQLNGCYKAAPATGSKNCRNWEAYCHDIQDQCGAGNYQGPPSCENHMPAKPKELTGGAVSAKGPMPSAAADASTSATVKGTYAQSSGNPASTAPVEDPVPVDSVPVASPVPASDAAATASGNKSTDGGSIDECGSRNGQTCKTGMCCSSQGSCGTCKEYFEDGCQSQYGQCSAPKHKRFHYRRSHVMRKKSLTL